MPPTAFSSFDLDPIRLGLGGRRGDGEEGGGGGGSQYSKYKGRVYGLVCACVWVCVGEWVGLCGLVGLCVWVLVSGCVFVKTILYVFAWV